MHGVRTMARQRAKSVMESFGESETELRNIWAAKERAENKRVPSDYDQLKAAFQKHKKGRNNWKQTLLDYREEVRQRLHACTGSQTRCESRSDAIE